jgi:lia operon protein LiaG
MKKVVYLMLVLFIVGVVGTLVTVSASGGFSLETYNVHDNVVVQNSDISSIEINISSADLMLHPSGENEIIVEMNGKISKKLKKKLKLDVQESGNKLTIGLLGEEQIKLNIGVLIVDTRVEVFLPQKIYDSLNIKTSSGDMEIQDFKAKETILKTSSGSLMIRDFHGKEHHFQSSSGEIILENVTGDITAESSSGDISIQLENETGDIDAKTSSGDVTIEYRDQPASLNLDFKGSSGDGEILIDGVKFEENSEHKIRGTIGSGDYKLNVRTSSGDFVLR